MNPAKTARLNALIALLEAAGHVMTDCPVLVPAGNVLDLVGPLTRGRLYLTTGIGSREFCLRPEFTISIAEAHLGTGAPGRPARYGYCGPVFRKRATGTGEFLQAGAESIGRDDAQAADADMVALAWSACRIFDIRPATVFGDKAVFTAVLTALDLPSVWHRRLQAAFGDRSRMDDALTELETDTKGPRDRFAGLGGLDPETATAIVEEMIGRSASLSNSGVIAGRHVNDIARRLSEKARLHDLSDRMREKTATIRAYLEIDCPIAEAESRIGRFSHTHGIDLDRQISAFGHRRALMGSNNEALGASRFQAAFGRPLDYYTGFIFDIFDAKDGRRPVCGGGRYDGLAERLGAPETVPAVGFSLWLDRLLPEGVA